MKLVWPLHDQPCWRVNYEPQLGLDLSFGEPYLEIREPRETTSKMRSVREHYARRQVTISASCWLWVQIASWTVTLGDGRRANWSTSAKRRNIVFANLEGEKVVRVDIQPETGKTRFDFDLGGSLVVKPFRQAEDDTLWTLYKPNGYCFTVRSDGNYCHARCSKVKELWQPIG